MKMCALKLLKNRCREVVFTGNNLDVPGRKFPKVKLNSSLKNQENQLYSQRGNGNENLERNRDHRQ